MTGDHVCVLVGLAFVVINVALLIFWPRREPRKGRSTGVAGHGFGAGRDRVPAVLELAALLRPDVEAAPGFRGAVDVVSFLGAVEMLDEVRPRPSRLAVGRSVVSTPAYPRWGNDRPISRQVW